MGHWILVVPTVRSEEYVGKVLKDLWASVTQPTDMVVLNGSEGCAPTLNYALEHMLDKSRHEYYATTNDDIYLPRGWQDELDAAFKEPQFREYGAFGADLAYNRTGFKVMREVAPLMVSELGTLFRPVYTVNLCGALIAMRSELALQVGPYPWDGQTKYQVNEDGWRCGRVWELGKKLAYIKLRCGKPRLLKAPTWDQERKMADLKKILGQCAG